MNTTHAKNTLIKQLESAALHSLRQGDREHAANLRSRADAQRRCTYIDD
jgi:hypothetical protein